MTADEVDIYIAAVLPLGSNVTVTANNAGELWLGMNDDAVSGGWQDNSGSLVATITLGQGAVPEPSSIVALLCGIGGVASVLVRKRK